jgi:aminoglycoside phosphotransferase (APT) family kinase protein
LQIPALIVFFYYRNLRGEGRKRRIAPGLPLMDTHYDYEIDMVLRMAFGRAVPTCPIPVGLGRAERYRAFALDDPEGMLPHRVVLARYSPAEMPKAFRAFTVMQALRALRYPVPQVYYLGWGRGMSHALMLADFPEARGMDGQIHAFFARVEPHFAQTLAYLHSLQWDEFPDLPVLPLRVAFDAVATYVRESGTSEMDTILDWLLMKINTVRELPYTVLHGDYTLGNVLAERMWIVSVLGWENALLADPRFDIGYASAALGAYGLALSDRFLAGYEAALGPVPDRDFWDVFSALRLLVRLDGFYDNAPPDQLEALKAQADPVWYGLIEFVKHRAHI